MKKEGMSLITLVITVIVLIVIAGGIITSIENTGIMDKAESVVDDMNLKNIEQLANMAYANIYLDNLSKGIRREIIGEEVRARMVKDGAKEQELSQYDITIKDGEVFVTLKEEE